MDPDLVGVDVLDLGLDDPLDRAVELLRPLGFFALPQGAEVFVHVHVTADSDLLRHLIEGAAEVLLAPLLALLGLFRVVHELAALPVVVLLVELHRAQDVVLLVIKLHFQTGTVDDLSLDHFAILNVFHKSFLLYNLIVDIG